MKRTLTVLSVALILLLIGIVSAPGLAQLPPRQAGKPKLLVFITIDQCRYDYLVRFRPLFKAGLKRLLDRGVLFAQAHQNHAVTATAPGHASLSTGLYPSHTGIIGNNWFDRDKKEDMYCVSDPGQPLVGSTSASSGRSPKNLLGTTLGDWMKKANPKSKVFSAGGKDRSAVLLGGKTADGAFWFDTRTGDFVTSRYYLKEYPEWVEEFHDRKIPDSYAGKTWEPLPDTDSLYKTAGIEEVDFGAFRRGFPYAFGGLSLFRNPSFYSAFWGSPYMDHYLVQFAKALIENESLGRDEHIDFLGLAFNAVDSVGHSYGPNSPEILDAFLRLDLALGELLEYLDQQVGSGNLLVVLGSDHGVMTLPEYLKMKAQPGGRVSTQDILCYQAGGAKFNQKFGEDDWLLEGFYLDYETIGRRNVRRQDVEDELARVLEQCPSVDRVWTRTQLESAPAGSDPYLQLFRNSFHPKRSPDLFVQLKEFYLGSTGTGTNHGSPYAYDTHVPLLFVIPGVSPAEISARVHTVDVAPTLAALLNVPAPGKLDGIDRSGLLRTRID